MFENRIKWLHLVIVTNVKILNKYFHKIYNSIPMPRTVTPKNINICYSVNSVMNMFIFMLFLMIVFVFYVSYHHPRETPQQQQQHASSPERDSFPVIKPHYYRTDTPQPVVLRHRNPYAMERFNRIGHLVCEDSGAIKPLYGRPKDRRGNKWHYYTSEHIDSNLNETVQLPIIVNNRECMNDWGCDELYDNDSVRVDNHDNTFKVKLYKQLCTRL